MTQQPKRLLKNWIKAYIEFTQHTEAPEKFHKWTAIATIAGALRRKVWLDMGLFTWSPNFYIVFVAPPGIVSKSTTSGIGLDLLKSLNYITFGPSSTSWQALIRFMAETAQIDYPMSDGSFFTMTPITIEASELGSFVDFKNGDMTAVLCDLYDGKVGTWTKLAKTSGNDTVVNPWINFVACTTPSWIAEHCGDYFSGGGLASRIMFVYGEKKRNLVAYPKRQMLRLGVDIEKWKAALTHDLELISNLNGDYDLTEEAYEWGERWYVNHYEKGNEILTGERFQGYLARKQTHIHKVAMVLSAAKRDDLMITPEELIEADQLVSELELDMPKVFAQANKEVEALLAADVLDFVQNKGKIRKNELFREFFKVMQADTFEKIIRSLVMGNFCRLVAEGSDLFIISNEMPGGE